MSSEIAPIVAFARDWGDDIQTSATHVLRHLGRDVPVYWINSIGTRKPDLASGRDLKRIFTKLASAMNQHFVQQENQIKVLSPLVIPCPKNSLSRGFNRFLLGRAVRRQLRKDGIRQVHLWGFIPSMGDYIGCFGEEAVVYYCVDDYSSLSGLDADWVQQMEGMILKSATVIFATSKRLVRRFQKVTSKPVHYSPHGVDKAKFAQALSAETRMPQDIAALPAPVIGFYGTVGDHLDIDLITSLAKARPAWSFAIIGQVKTDISAWDSLPNVHSLPARSHDELPACCKGFALSIIPYRMDHPLIASVNPVKLRELLAAGVPVVAAPMEEVADMEPEVLTAVGHEDWLQAMETQLKQDHNTIAASPQIADWQDRVHTIKLNLRQATLPEAS